jgi:hypothetical protein
MPPTLRSRQRPSRSTASSSSSSSLHRIAKPAAKTAKHTRKMVSTRSQSSRKSGPATAPATAPAIGAGVVGSRASSTISASTTTSQTFPELVRSRVAYSPSPSLASHSEFAMASLTPHDILSSHAHNNNQRQHLLWPSQLCSSASTATAAPLAARAASSASSAGSPEPVRQARVPERVMRDNDHLDVYRETLEFALRNGARR